MQNNNKMIKKGALCIIKSRTESVNRTLVPLIEHVLSLKCIKIFGKLTLLYMQKEK